MSQPHDAGDPGFSSEWTRRELPSYGPGWDRAIEYGIDVSLLLEDLALTPAQRLARLQQMVEFHETLRQARRVDE